MNMLSNNLKNMMEKNSRIVPKKDYILMKMMMPRKNSKNKKQILNPSVKLLKKS